MDIPRRAKEQHMCCIWRLFHAVCVPSASLSVCLSAVVPGAEAQSEAYWKLLLSLSARALSHFGTSHTGTVTEA